MQVVGLLVEQKRDWLSSVPFYILQIVLLRHVNWFFKIYQITIFVFNLVVTFVNFVVEVIATTFPAIIIITDFIMPFGIFGAISFSFFKSVSLCDLVNFNIIVVIYVIFSHFD